MKFDLSSQNTRILQEQKKHRQWVMIFLGLSVTVILGTVAALKLYGQALTHKVKVLDCQAKVHEHTDECYVYDEEKEEDVLVCGFAGYLAHVHNDDCRDENGRLVCPLEEIEPHKHVDACFEEQQVLVCELEGIEPAQGDNTGTAANQPVKTPDGGEESQPVKTPESESQPEGNTEAASQPAEETAAETEAPTAPAVLETTLVCIMAEHTHTDACYGEAEPACTMTEHTHGDGCYERALTCDKNEHQHDDSCNDEEGNLICELEEHAHEEVCYEEKLICEEEEHSHTDACAAGEATLTCEAEEHTHTDACYEQVAARTEAPETTAPAETKAPETEAPETTAAETTAAPTTVAAETTAAPETTAEAGTHIHTADCYETKLVPICGKLENHTHDDDCYDENGKLICELLQLEEHRHNKDCFKTVELTSEEIAALNAGAKLHIHHDDCYDENGELICGHEETHIHGEKCYDRNGKLICGHEEAHVHSDGCYDKNGDIICGLEVVLHEHRDDCYDENGKLICDHAHIHEESCFDEDGNMTCDFEEVGDYLWTCEEEDYIVTVKFNREAEIPGNAKLLAEQITADGENQEYFAQREEEYKEAMKDETAEMRALLHIGFYVENKEAKENEEKLIEIEPKKPVTVTVQFLDEDGLKEGEPITVVHFADEGTELLDGGQAEDNRATFEMNGFSEIAIGYGDEGAKAEVSVSGNEINDGDGSVSGNEIEKEKTIHLDDSFEYEDEAFHITFHVKGDAVLPENVADEEKKDDSVSSEYASLDEGVIGSAGGEEEEETKAESEEELKPEETEAETEKVSRGDVSDKQDESLETESSEDETTQAVKKAARERVVVAVSGESNAEETLAETEINAVDIDKEIDQKNVSGDGIEETITDDNANGSLDVELDESLSIKTEKSESYSAEDSEIEHELEFQVVSLDETTEEYNTVVTFTENMSEENGLFEIRVLSYLLLCDGEKLDLTDCEVTAEVTPTQKLIDEVGQTPVALELEDDVQSEVMLTAMNLTMVVPEEEEDQEEKCKIIDAIPVSTIDFQSQPMTFVLEVAGDENIMALSTSSQADRLFTVQYYANLDVLKKDADISKVETLKVIDTSGKKLPKNGNANSQKIIGLQAEEKKEDVSESFGRAVMLETENELTEVYSEKEYHYITAPSLTYFNILAQNGNYKLEEIWVLKEGSDKTSTSREDWDIYSCREKDWHFTNRLETSAVEPDFIYIKENAVIRLVCNVTAEKSVNNTLFYDYDISNGNIYSTKNTNDNGPTGSIIDRGSSTVYNDKANRAWYMYTEKQGINNNNANNSGGKNTAQNLGFGNGPGVNKTGMGENKWNGYELNKANTQSYGDCTFELVTRLETDGTIQYAEGVNAPNLFNDGAANGKTEHEGHLTFERKGDTYTLVAAEAGGVTINELDKFHGRKNWNGSRYIWSNCFYPLDGVTSAGTKGHDIKFGDTASFSASKIMAFTKSKNMRVPESDDGKAHNHYFGMYYTVDFDLTEDYVGPLEYIFYGDDDMWVFLNGEGKKIERSTDAEGNEVKTETSKSINGELVCDIGGVHSSVGEYVDLWDYIDKGTEGHYTLSFFYTERGASGSTCWMQFTLPSVSFKTPTQTTGQLEIKKAVTGGETESEEFGFGIKFYNANGDRLRDSYAYTKYDENGNIIDNDLLIWNDAKFFLKANENIKISYLPVNTKFEITEIGPVAVERDADGNVVHGEDGNPIWEVQKDNPYNPLITGGDVSPDNPKQVTGNVSIGNVITIDYNNVRKFELPKTGGPGPELYTMSGAICLVFGAGFMYRKKFRGRRV